MRSRRKKTTSKSSVYRRGTNPDSTVQAVVAEYGKRPRRERHKVLNTAVRKNGYSATLSDLDRMAKAAPADAARFITRDKEWLVKNHKGASAPARANSRKQAHTSSTHKANPYRSYRGKKFYQTAGTYRMTHKDGSTQHFGSLEDMKAHIDGMVASERAPAAPAWAANPLSAFAPQQTPFRANHHLTVGQRARYTPLVGVFGTIAASHPGDIYDVRWETTGQLQPGVQGSRLVAA